MKKLTFLTLISIASIFTLNAQRIVDKMDRGVVVVNKGSNKLFISWRFFATDPENIAFNLYRQVGAGTPTLLNSTPITGATNYLWTVTGTALSIASRFYVKPVLNGVEGAEEGSWNLASNPFAGVIVQDVTFQAPPVGYKEMPLLFSWPGDLDGDGKYDYVVDRHPGGLIDSESDTLSSIMPVFVEAYNSDGTFKWRMNSGTNVKIASGQGDKLTVYDLDGDGKAEVCMAVSEGTTFADGTIIKNADGTVHDYSTVTGSAPQWIAVVNGETGNLIDTVSLSMFDEIKSDRVDKWKDIGGQCSIQYLDGIHPFLTYQYKTRRSTGEFNGGTETWRLINGKLIKNWAHRFPREDREYEGHQYRIADVDGDGKDEFVQISYTIDDDGSMLYSVPKIYHGDRHCLADIDPDRPGLEHFFIQQYNIIGMGINDAATGEMIKAQYLSSAVDVGRGICGAFDPNRRGMQYYSTISNNAMFDCKGKLTGSNGSFPAEALWWGGSLCRAEIDAAGSAGNPVIEAYDPSSKTMVRSVNLYKGYSNGKADYYFLAPNGGRAAFWGDILGDWREELIYGRADNTGFVVISNYDITTHRQYCLMQNPAYRAQTTLKGYYETPDVDFYMATDMPEPPVAPVQTADVYMTSDNAFSAATMNNKSVMLDIRNTRSNISLNENLTPTRLWLMNPKGHNYTISGTGKFTGAMDVVKSLQGDVTFNGNYDYTGKTRISEGRLFVNGTLASPVQLNARGVIGGNATLNGGITLETGLNIEGGRLEPGNGAETGTLTIGGNLVLPGRNTLAFDIDETKTIKNDRIIINGNFTVSGTNNFMVFKPVTAIGAGEFTLVTFTGTSNATKSNFTVKGLEGIPYTLVFEANAIRLIITQPRTSAPVAWNGGNSTTWDFETKNFLKNAVADIFVPGDSVTFNDNAASKTLTVNETMPVSQLIFNNSTNFKISGDGAISGNGGLVKTGTGTVSLLTEENKFTGKVDFSDGILEVASLKDGGLPSSIGASSGDATNWIMRNATLQTAGQMATMRDMTVVGKLTVNNPLTSNSVMIGGNITGTGITMELTGAGTLNLQGTNAFSSVNIKNGTLALGSIVANNYGVGAGTINLEGGTLVMRDANDMTNTGPWKNTIDVPEGKSAAWNLPMRWNFTNKLTGKGTLSIYIPYVRDEFQGDWSAFEGTIRLTTDGDGGEFRINNSYGYGKATIDLASGINLYHLSTGRTIKLGGLSGVSGAKLSGDNTTWQVGGYNTGTTTFAGIISGTGAKLTKEGSGIMILSNANTYTGLTDVTAGTLMITNTTGSATGTNAVTVRTGAKFGGTGIASGNVTVYANSFLDLQNNVCAAISVGGNLSLATNSTFNADVNASTKQADVVNVGGTVSISGNLNLNNISAAAIASGNEFKILNATGAISGSFAQITPSLSNNLVWDQSKLTSGIIAVKTITDTHDHVFDGQKEVVKIEFFTLTGVVATEFSKGFVLRKTLFSDGSFQIKKIINNP